MIRVLGPELFPFSELELLRKISCFIWTCLPTILATIDRLFFLRVPGKNVLQYIFQRDEYHEIYTSTNYLHHSLPRKETTVFPKPPEFIPRDSICSEYKHLPLPPPFFPLPDNPNPFIKAQLSFQKQTYCSIFKFFSKTQENQPE